MKEDIGVRTAEEVKADEEEKQQRMHTELFYLLAEHQSHFSVDDRIKAAMLYAAEGNLSKVSRDMEIGYETLKDWKCQPWWPLAVQECRDRKQDELDAMLSKVMFSAIEQIADRIKDGDYVAKKDGTFERVPMKGRDLTITMGVLYDKRALIRGQATSSTVSVSHGDKLTQLAAKMEEFGKTLESKTVEVIEVKDA